MRKHKKEKAQPTARPETLHEVPDDMENHVDEREFLSKKQAQNKIIRKLIDQIELDHPLGNNNQDLLTNDQKT